MDEKKESCLLEKKKKYYACEQAHNIMFKTCMGVNNDG